MASIINDAAQKALQDSGVIDADKLEILQQSEAGSLLIHAPAASLERRSDEHGLIVKLLVDSEVPRSIPNVPSDVSTQKIVPQSYSIIDGLHVLVRPYVNKPLSQDSIFDNFAALSSDPEQALDRVRSFFRDILTGLGAIHALGIPHGDLQPNKISRKDDGAYEIRDPGVPEVFSYREFRYIPPEQIIDRSSASISGDIYAFLHIALDATKPYRGSRRHHKIARIDAQLRWLKDYFHSNTDRPSSQSLNDLLVNDRIPAEFRSSDVVLDAYNASSRVARRRGGVAVREISKRLEAYPETAFEVGNPTRRKSVENLLLLEKLAGGIFAGKKKRIRTRLTEASDEHRITDFSPDLDSRWINSIHITHFGFPIDSKHAARIEAMSLSDEEVVAAGRYRRSLEAANAARLELLRENSFLSTSGVINELRLSGIELDGGGVTVARRWGKIIAVPDHGRWLYPTFQFRNGELSQVVERSHRVHIDRRQGVEPSPWAELTFFSMTRDALDGRALKDCLWTESMRGQVKKVVEEAQI